MTRSKTPYAAGHVGQHHGHLRHEVAGQEVDEADAQIIGQQHIHAGGGSDQVPPGHDHLGHGDAGDGEDEFLAEDMDRFADGEAQHQIGKGNGQQDASQEAYVMDGHLGQQLVRDHGRRQQEDHAAQSQGTDTEGDGQHEHKTDDLDQGKAPGRIEPVADARTAQQCPEVVADGLPYQGNEPHTRQGQGFVDGLQGEPVIAHQDDVVDDHQADGETDTDRGDLLDAFSDLGDAVSFELVIQEIYGQHEKCRYEYRPQVTQVFFHGVPAR